MCDHLQTVLSKLSTSGRLHLSTTGPPRADNSLLSVGESSWSSATTTQNTGNSMKHGTAGSVPCCLLLCKIITRLTVKAINYYTTVRGRHPLKCRGLYYTPAAISNAGGIYGDNDLLWQRSRTTLQLRDALQQLNIAIFECRARVRRF